jgi:putative two-component system response regulator
VRDTILLKPGKLTDGEYAMIKLHPVIGARILDPIPSLKDMLPIVLHHHERLDGKGYPEGLKGSEIPLMARMTAVADTYDALTSDRAYRKGMNQADAMGVIDGVRGSQLCPDCVDLMLKVLENEPEPVAVLPDGRADDPTVDA